MNQKVYVACPDSQEIHVFDLSHDGDLSLVQIVDVPGQVQPMTFSKDKQFLYVGVRPEFRVLSYAIDANTGKLELKGSASLTGSPTHVAIDNSGHYFLSASYSFNCVSVSPIATDGVVLEPIKNIENITAPHSVNPLANSTTLLIPALKEDSIRVFNQASGEFIETDGALSVAKGAGPRHMAFHSSLNVGYCINELDSTINIIKLPNQQGADLEILQSISSVPADFKETCWSADIHITPNNQFLYTTERTTSIISAFQLNAEGLIEQTIGFFDTEEQPRGFAIDLTGHFLICTGQKSDKLSLYTIDQITGELKNRVAYPIGKGAMWVLIN